MHLAKLCRLYPSRCVHEICRGDPGNEFRLATFFPEFAQPAVDRTTGLFSWRRAEGSETKGQAVAAGSALGSEPSEAARRRCVLYSCSMAIARGSEGISTNS